MSDPMVSVRKARGRPKALEPRTAVSTWIQARHHDRLIKLANQRDISLSALVRAIVIRAVDPK